MIEFDHPCKQTCSGWKQGYEQGVATMKDQCDAMRAVVDAAFDFTTCEEGGGLAFLRMKEALAKLGERT